MKISYFKLIFIQFAKTMHVASKLFGVNVARNQDIASNFIGVDAVWLGGMSHTSKYKRKISIDWLITKFTKKVFNFNFVIFFVFVFCLLFLNYICLLRQKVYIFMFLTMQHQNIKLSMLILSVHYAKHY